MGVVIFCDTSKITRLLVKPQLGIPSCSLSMVTQTGYSRVELKHVENTLLSQAYRSVMCRGLLVFFVTPTNTKTVYKTFNKFA